MSITDRKLSAYKVPEKASQVSLEKKEFKMSPTAKKVAAVAAVVLLAAGAGALIGGFASGSFLAVGIGALTGAGLAVAAIGIANVVKDIQNPCAKITKALEKREVKRLAQKAKTAAIKANNYNKIIGDTDILELRKKSAKANKEFIEYVLEHAASKKEEKEYLSSLYEGEDSDISLNTSAEGMKLLTQRAMNGERIAFRKEESKKFLKSDISVKDYMTTVVGSIIDEKIDASMYYVNGKIDEVLNAYEKKQLTISELTQKASEIRNSDEFKKLPLRVRETFSNLTDHLIEEVLTNRSPEVKARDDKEVKAYLNKNHLKTFSAKNKEFEAEKVTLAEKARHQLELMGAIGKLTDRRLDKKRVDASFNANQFTEKKQKELHEEIEAVKQAIKENKQYVADVKEKCNEEISKYEAQLKALETKYNEYLKSVLTTVLADSKVGLTSKYFFGSEELTTQKLKGLLKSLRADAKTLAEAEALAKAEAKAEADKVALEQAEMDAKADKAANEGSFFSRGLANLFQY
ncbi:MAG: hypothetical protein K1060chlam5_00428 [Candidatus Anoxychlamydiales bacterium]|nr:hypothetical protein [Candidatus Anoxychlamydiales bacterium]